MRSIFPTAMPHLLSPLRSGRALFITASQMLLMVGQMRLLSCRIHGDSPGAIPGSLTAGIGFGTRRKSCRAPTSPTPARMATPVKRKADTLRLSQSGTESTSGIQKEMRVTLASSGPGVKVEHVLTNHNVWPVTLSVWALSIVAPGGKVVLPQEPFVSHDDELVPARPLVLWKFTDMSPTRAGAGEPSTSRWPRRTISIYSQKIGLYNAQGWGAHPCQRAGICDLNSARARRPSGAAGHGL